MNFKSLKKNYIKKHIQSIILNSPFIFFVQYNNLNTTQKQQLILNLKHLDLKLKVLKNKSTFLTTSDKNILFSQGSSCLIYAKNINNNKQENFFDSLNFLHKNKIMYLSLKFNSKIINKKKLLKILKYKNNNNLKFNFFNNLNNIKNPNLNLKKNI